MNKSSRVCALCDTIVPNNHVVCKDHYEEYKLYKNEQWFKELSSAARRQFEIDNEETAIQMGDFPKTSQNRRKLTENDKKLILEYREKGFGRVSIAKLLAINPNTIESFLKRFKDKTCN